MNVRHALLSIPLALAFAAPASAQEVIEETQQSLADNPPVECRVTFLVGPVACRVEREWRAAFDPDHT